MSAWRKANKRRRVRERQRVSTKTAKRNRRPRTLHRTIQSGIMVGRSKITPKRQARYVKRLLSYLGPEQPS